MQPPPEQYLITRRVARGDVLLCTPIVAALKRKYPEAVFDFKTEYPDVLRGNPHLRRIGGLFNVRDYRQVVNLEVAYEKMPCTHLIDAFQSGAERSMGEKLDVVRRLDLPIPPDVLERVSQTIGLGNFVVLAPGPGAWPGRNWSVGHWCAVVREIMPWCPVVLVGTDDSFDIPCTLDLRNQTSYIELAAVIKLARVFVGIDSFPAHVAGACATPRVVLFGITHAKYILCDAPHTFPIESDPNHRFTGARHYVERISSVRLGNPPRNPMDTIGSPRVVEAIIKAYQCLKKDTF